MVTKKCINSNRVVGGGGAVEMAAQGRNLPGAPFFRSGREEGLLTPFQNGDGGF